MPEISAVRDYFQVEDEAGQRFWLFRTSDGADPASGPQREMRAVACGGARVAHPQARRLH